MSVSWAICGGGHYPNRPRHACEILRSKLPRIRPEGALSFPHGRGLLKEPQRALDRRCGPGARGNKAELIASCLAP